MPGRLASYSFNWKLSLFTALMLPVLIMLGLWQLDRETEKQILQDLYEARQAAVPTDFTALNREQDLQYISLRIRGSFDENHVFLLDNRTNAGRAGYEVLQPFYTASNDLIMVNRGWIQQGAYRNEFPEISRISGEVSISGYVYVPLGEPFMLGESRESDEWPKRIQRLDLPAMAAELDEVSGKVLFPYSVRLAENSPGVLQRNWPLLNIGPEKHRAYAVQWFAMALVLAGLYLFVSTRPEEQNKTAD